MSHGWAALAVVAALVALVGFGASAKQAMAQGGPDPQFRIEGKVLGPDGNPLKGISARAFGELGTASFGPWTGRATGPDGEFSIETPDGSFGVELFRTINGVECKLGYVNHDGSYTFNFGLRTRTVIRGQAVTGLTVQLPNTPSALCRPIRGTVTGVDGQSLGVVGISVDGNGPLRGQRQHWATKADGTFTLYGQAGSYSFRVATMLGSACTVLDSANPNPTRARVQVTDDGARDIRVVISGEPSNSLQRFVCSAPPVTMTSKLQPGWNLAGWTGHEVDASELLGAIPSLEVVHAWDAEGGRFLTAAAGVPDEVAGLKTLTPGMGLWLYVGGTSPVEWTRAFLPESGLVTLAEGWNLVSLSGGDGASVQGALAGLDSELRSAAGWDATNGQWMHYSPEAPGTENTLRELPRGAALWLDVSRDRYWLQPGSEELTIEYVSEIASHARASLPSSIESVVTYFAHRFGVFVPGLTWVIGEHETVCGGYLAGNIFLEEPCLRATAHEYTHAIQEQLAGPGNSPTWFTEGVANRWSAEYYDATGDRSYSTHFAEVVIPQARGTPRPLEEMEAGRLTGDHGRENYSVAHLAIDWLISLADEDRVLDYYLQRPAYSTWQEAFLAVFGISVPDFYESFARHRSEVASVLPQVSGTVLDHEGNPLAGARLRAAPQDGQPSTSATVGDDGGFTLGVHEGTFVLEVHTPAEEGTRHAGWYSSRGRFTLRLDEAARIVMGDADVAVSIRVPELTWRRIEGVVLGPNGQPLEGITVDAFPAGEVVGLAGVTDATGAFSIDVIPGPFTLGLSGRLGERLVWLGWYGGGDGFASGASDILVVDTEGGDVRGITIKLPYDPSQPRHIQGTVVGPSGEPLEGITVDADPVGPGLGLATTTDAQGAFSTLVVPGSYVLRIGSDLAARVVWLGWYGGEAGVTTRQEAIVTPVGGVDVRGITVTLATDASRERRIEGVVIGPTGEPLEDITVAARPTGEGAGLDATTDEKGAFSIPVLQGTFRLDLIADSPDGRKGIGVYTADGGFSPLGANPAAVGVGEEDVSGLVIRLPFDPAEWRRIEGVVRAPDGQPVEGVNVDAYPTGETPGLGNVTSEDGTFSIAVLPGPFRLDLWTSLPSGWRYLGSSGGETGFVSLLADADVVEVGAGDVTGLTINLPLDPRETTWRSISGVVMGHGGAPLEGVEVVGRTAVGYAEWEVHTDAEGRFEARVLATTYEIGFNHGRCPMGWYAGGSTLVEGRTEALTISTREGDVTGITVNAGDHCVRIQGVVLGRDGEPAGGILVRSRATWIGNRRDGHDWPAKTDEEGRFDVVASRGSYRVTVTWKECFLDWTSNRRDMSLLSPVERSLVVRASTTGLVFTLRDVPEEVCRPFEGVASWADGRPLANTHFWVILELNQDQWEHGLDARTGPDGAFAITVRVGIYRVSYVTEAFGACTVSAREHSTGERGPMMEIGSEGVTGLGITVSGPAPDELRGVQCTFAE